MAQRLAHLARNGLIEIRVGESGGRCIGYVSRTRQIAARWGITIPLTEATEAQAATA
jgi:hypothetical protein